MTKPVPATNQTFGLGFGQARFLPVQELARKDDNGFRSGDGDWDLREVPVAIVE